jgi:beta-N-acetylhexosaminidase
MDGTPMKHSAAFALALAVSACGSSPSAPPVPAPFISRMDAAAINAAMSDPWVERTLQQLTLRQKVGQLMMPRIGSGPLTTDSDDYERLRAWVQDLGVGGVLVGTGTPAVVAARLNALQRLAPLPLLVSADFEPGPVQDPAMTTFPPLMGVGATGDPQLAYEVGRITAIEARAQGVHITFAPVVDVNNNPDNPIINARSYGEDPQRVAAFAVQHVRGLQEHGLLATAKHFPGHGNSSTDSHLEMPVLGIDRNAAAQVELVPYQAVIPAGIGGVMTGHIAFPAIAGDTIPSSLHAKISTALLRDELGFRGIVVTDALDMGAITKQFADGRSAVMALQAGADVLLQPLRQDVPIMIDAIVAAVESGAIPQARIDASVRRVLALKKLVGLDRNRLVNVDRIAEMVRTPANVEIGREVMQRSITVARDRDRLLPLDPARTPRLLNIVYTDEPRLQPGRTLNTELRTRFSALDTVRLDASATPAQLEALTAQASAADVVLFSSFVRASYAKNNIAVAAPVAAWLDQLATSRRVIAVSFGSPYLLVQFPQVGTYVLAWGGEEVSQRAVARALTGEAAITGALPVNIAPYHRIGDGVRVEPRR